MRVTGVSGSVSVHIAVNNSFNSSHESATGGTSTMLPPLAHTLAKSKWGSKVVVEHVSNSILTAASATSAASVSSTAPVAFTARI